MKIIQFPEFLQCFKKHEKYRKNATSFNCSSQRNYNLMIFSALLLGATYALPLVTSFRYEFRKTKGLSAEDILKLQEKGIIRKNPEHLTLEQLHDEYKDKFNLEDYENLRIPKPWDNDETKLDQLRTSNKKLKSVKETRLIPDPE